MVVIFWRRHGRGVNESRGKRGAKGGEVRFLQDERSRVVGSRS
jgi:hypothetical protein